MNSIIEKPRIRRNYNNKVQRNFACKKNIGVTQPKTKKKRKLGARNSYINKARNTSHVKKTIRNYIIKSRKMKTKEQ